ncbi:MAG TPA: DUF952 domain-containing protein [Acidimicrobiales bacterium]|nr:DUF952 domain-containing protein [Acidimicrobiales bacterium]
MPKIFHIAREADWQAALTGGTYRISTVGRSLEDEGFIHCSQRHQVAGVANAFYRGRADLVLLVIDTDLVAPDIRYEASDGGTERFPHIYGPLNVESVVAVEPLKPRKDGAFSPLS